MKTGADLTIVSWGSPIYTIETALHLLQNPPEDLAELIPKDLRNLSVELIDLRTIIPYDVSLNAIRSSSRSQHAVPAVRSKRSSRA